MKQLIQRIISALMPPGLEEAEQAEDLLRARTLVFLLLLLFLCAVIGTISSMVIISLAPTTIDHRSPYLLLGAALGFTSGLWVFRNTGLNIVSGNILAATFYTVIVLGSLPLSGQMLFGSGLYLLALPFLVTLATDYISALVWVAMVAIAPIIWNTFGAADFSRYFIANWMAVSCGLFGVIYGSHTYLNRLSQRYHAQHSWLEFVAGHDALTGAANRATFDRRLIDSITLCKMHGGKSVLVYIDLDKFKPINDTHGHQAGDIVLTAVADRLRKLVRKSDTVARLGGDEFAILFDQCSPDGVKPVIDRVATVIGEPIEVSGKPLSVSCSLGVVVCPDDGLDPAQLAHKADERMYAAKRTSGTSHVLRAKPDASHP